MFQGNLSISPALSRKCMNSYWVPAVSIDVDIFTLGLQIMGTKRHISRHESNLCIKDFLENLSIFPAFSQHFLNIIPGMPALLLGPCCQFRSGIFTPADYGNKVTYPEAWKWSVCGGQWRSCKSTPSPGAGHRDPLYLSTQQETSMHSRLPSEAVSLIWQLLECLKLEA